MDKEKSSKNMQKKAEKRQLILNAARKIFTRDGYHNARVETIAVEAGVGKGTVYEYFSSKQELFQKMLEENNLLYQKVFFHFYLKGHSLEDSLYYVIKKHIELCIANRDMTFLIMQELPSMRGELKEWFIELNKRRERIFREHIEEVMRDHIIRDVDIDALVFLLFGLLASMELEIAVGRWNRDIDQISRAITDIILHGIGPEKA